jgi:sec-independent protein translocase protein TatA
MHFGFGELLLIFLVIMLIFGSSKLPQLGDALGRGIKNFKKATTEEDSIDVSPKKIEGTAPSTTGATPAERSAPQKK